MIEYIQADDVKQTVLRLIKRLHFDHIDIDRLHFYRSRGSRARRVRARIHGLPRIWHQALEIRAHYVVEVIGEEFDRLSPEEKTKTIIHEILHIPKGFGGGFVQHGESISKRRIDRLYIEFVKQDVASGPYL